MDDPELLRAALIGYEAERQKIEAKIAQIRKSLKAKRERLPGAQKYIATKSRKRFSARKRAPSIGAGAGSLNIEPVRPWPDPKPPRSKR
jgi:hypothetical protein